MNESKETCAPENVVLTDAERWKSIDRRKAEDYVRKLQARIVSQSVSAPLQSGIRFFHVPISAPRIGSPCGLLTTSEEAERYGLTTFRVSDCDGLGPSYSPAVLMSV